MESLRSKSPSRVIAVVAVAAIAALIWLLLDDRTPSSPPTRPPAAGDASTASTVAGTLTSPDTAAALRSPADPSPTPTVVAANEPTVTVRGRCVAAGDGSPLPDCLALLRLESGPDAKELPWLDDATTVRMVTTADGVFELGVHHDAWLDVVALRLSSDTTAHYFARWPRPRPGTVIELGDVAMARAITVTGTIVDRQGLPVADAGMMFVDVQLDGKPAAAPETMLRARSDRAGRFAFPLPAYPAEWWIAAEDTGALVEPRSVKLTAEQTEYLLQVVVERPDPSFSITGRVVDTGNQPLPNMRLSAIGEGWIGRGRSGIDGRFTVQRAGPMPDRGAQGTALSCSDPDGIYEVLRPDASERIAWATNGVEIIMRRKASRSVLVVDAQGQPVTDYTLFALRGKTRLMRSSSRRGGHRDGRTMLNGLVAGDHALIVVPRATALGSTELIPFVVDGDVPTGELRVNLAERVPLQVEVSAAGGGAVAGSTVQLLQSFVPEPPTATGAAVDLRDFDASQRTPPHAVVAEAVTAGDGTAELRAPVGRWSLRITGKHHIAIVQPVVVAPPSARMQLTVAAAGLLQGAIEPAEDLATLRDLARAGEVPIAVIVTATGAAAMPPAPVDDDGRYAIGGLPAGSYRVALRYWLRTGAVRSDYVSIPVDEVTLTAGQHRTLAIDVSSLLPGTVSGRVLAGGEPLRDVHCFLRLQQSKGKTLALRVATDGDGRFNGLVPPGRYGYAITYPAQPGPGWLHMVLSDEWDLAPGADHVVDFDVPLRRVRVRLLDADDQAIADVRVKIVRDGYSLPGGLKTDTAGWVEIFPAPLDAFELEADLTAGKQTLGPIDLPPGATDGDVVLHTGG